MEYIEIPFNTINELNSSSETSSYCNIIRNGDLVHDVYFMYDLPSIYNYFVIPESYGIVDSSGSPLTSLYIPFQWIDGLGNRLIEEVSFDLNSQSISRLRGDYMEIYNQLNLSKDKKEIYDKMINSEYRSSVIQDLNYNISDNGSYPSIPSTRLYIPLDFWFCKNMGMALPLIAMQYTFSRLSFKFSKLNDLYKIGNPLISPSELLSNNNLSPDNQIIYNYLTALEENTGFSKNNLITLFTPYEWNQYYSILANYIFLGDDERKYFAQSSHEYLIDQNQYFTLDGLKRGFNTIDVNFNHPVKEFIWYLKKDLDTPDNNWFNFTDIQNVETINKSIEFKKFITYMKDITNNLINENTVSNLNSIDLKLNEIIKNKFNVIYNSNDNNHNVYLDKFDMYSIMETFKVIFNGNDRFERRFNKFFELVQVKKYHSGCSKKGLYVYSFSLNPEDKFQPKGACNMSRITKQQLEIKIFNTNNIENYLDRFTLHFYAVNYNLFRIIGGIGQITFSN